MNIPSRLLPALVLSACALLRPALAGGQGTAEDYARADRLAARVLNTVFKGRVDPHWSTDGHRFWYRNDLPGGAKEFLLVDASRRERRPAFDHAGLAAALNRSTGKSYAADRLPFARIEVLPDGAVRFEADSKPWLYDPGAETLQPSRPLEADRPAPAPEGDRRGPRRRGFARRNAESPDGEWTVNLKDHNLILRRKESGDEFAMTRDGVDGDAYEPAVFWSPDSKRFFALKTAKGDERRVQLIESSPRDQVQPKQQSYNYLKPGDRLTISKPHLFDMAEHKEIPVKDDLFSNPWSLDGFRWWPGSSRFTFLYNQRGHQAERIVSIDAETGEDRAIIDETSDTFVDYSQKTYRHDLDAAGEILWMSERDGWNHLYLFDAATGAIKNQVTKGEWVVRGVDRVDEEKRQVWFRAGGIRPGQDPYHIHFARVNLDGTGLVILTEGDGTHEVAYSPDRRYLIDTYSRVDLPPVVELRSADDGSLVCPLETADATRLVKSGWQAPERFVAKGRDGQTDIYGMILRPTNFDPAKKYPVIEQIYAGPHGAHVPKRFSPLQRPQVLAELGFILVQIDGMGTNWRSRAFHDVCWKNLADAGFPDRIAWMKAATEKHPEMDLSRVGIYGGSAGGQNAMGALLFHPEFYKAAVADCGCHDNRMDKIWWNEAWMGWPVGPHYAEQSNVTNAHKLRGKLLLTVGELDHNVDPASTMQVVNALIKAGKDFEFIVFPGADHGAGGGRYGQRRMRDFFVRNLLHVEPPDRNGG